MKLTKELIDKTIQSFDNEVYPEAKQAESIALKEIITSSEEFQTLAWNLEKQLKSYQMTATSLLTGIILGMELQKEMSKDEPNIN